VANKSVKQKPSGSALIAALRRTLANQEFHNNRFGPDYLAESFLPPHFRFFLSFKNVRTNTKEKLDGFLPGLTEYIIARTAYFDSLFAAALNDSTPQIVILGAGYDSRVYRFARLIHGTKIFELDIAPTQDRKKKCLKKAKIEIPQQVAFVPIDFNQESLKNVLEKAGWQTNQKTLFLWEGVSYYLDPASVDAILVFFSHSAHQDSTLAFDYGISITEANIADYYGAKEFIKTMKEQQANEEVLFSIDEGKTESFLEQRNLKMVEHIDKEAIERTFLTDDNGLLIGQITGHLRFVLAAPKNQ
jgi:methyltransferase (TIGR00027 family)